VINEFYGPAVARKTVWLGLAANLVLVTFGQLVVGAPPAFDTPVTQALAPLFAFAPRLLAGGLLAYVISQFIDVWLFFSLRRAFNDKHLWLRTAGSTAISQAIDTVVVYMIAFSGSVPDLRVGGVEHEVSRGCGLGTSNLCDAGSGSGQKGRNLMYSSRRMGRGDSRNPSQSPPPDDGFRCALPILRLRLYACPAGAAIVKDRRARVDSRR